MGKVQMLGFISGGRWDGRVWPPAGQSLVVPDWEEADLIAARLAQPWPRGFDAEPEPAPEPEPADAAAAATVTEAVQQGDEVTLGADPDPDPEPDLVIDVPGETGEPEGGPPRPSAPKSEWVAWAVKAGCREDVANAYTKQELMEQYGGRA